MDSYESFIVPISVGTVIFLITLLLIEGKQPEPDQSRQQNRRQPQAEQQQQQPQHLQQQQLRRQQQLRQRQQQLRRQQQHIYREEGELQEAIRRSQNSFQEQQRRRRIGLWGQLYQSWSSELWKQMPVSTEKCCLRCNEDEAQGETRTMTGCGHPICSQCLENLFKASAPDQEKGVTRTLCPICRVDLMDSIHPPCSWCQNKVSERLPDCFCGECGQVFHKECAPFSPLHKLCSGECILEFK